MRRSGPKPGPELSRAQGAVVIAGGLESSLALEQAQARIDEETAWEDQRVNELVTTMPELDPIQAIRQARSERITSLVDEIERVYAEQPVEGASL